jgi:hypothetical protein
LTSDKQLIVISALAIGAYFLLKNAFGQKPMTTEQVIKSVQSAGGTVTYTDNGVFWQIPGGAVDLTQEWSPNFAQKILVGLDKIIPGDWLSRKAYGL